MHIHLISISSCHTKVLKKTKLTRSYITSKITSTYQNKKKVLQRQSQAILNKTKWYYDENVSQILHKRHEHYEKNTSQILTQRKEHYKANCSIVLRRRKQNYLQNKPHNLNNRCIWYVNNRSKIIAKCLNYYYKSKAIRKNYVMRKYAQNPSSKIKSVKSYNKKHKKQKSHLNKLIYSLKEPTNLHCFVQNLQKKLQSDNKICYDIVEQFKQSFPQNCDQSHTKLSLASTKIVSKRLLSNAIGLRRQKVGSLIKAYNSVLEKIKLNLREDFG